MKLKPVLFASVLAATLSVPAFANDAAMTTPLPQFTAADTQMLFEQDVNPMQLAALSKNEMKETEGALLPAFYYGGAFLLVNAPRISQFGMNMLNTSAYQPVSHAMNWVNHQRVTYWPNSRWW
jgi:hypothetical protein